MQEQNYIQLQPASTVNAAKQSRLKLVFIIVSIVIIILAIIATCIVIFKENNTIFVTNHGWTITRDERSNENIITLALEVENTSKNKYASDITVAAEVYDNGKEVASIVDACYIEYLAPNDKAYCASNIIQESDYNITDMAFTINGKTLKYSNYNANEQTNSNSFEVTDIDDEDKENISCTIRNNSSVTVNNPIATIVFYKDGKIIGGASGEIEEETLPSKGETSIQFYGNRIQEYDEYKIGVTGI